MNAIKNITSYFFPVMVEARGGKVTPYLEVIRFQGKYILNSHQVNYSFGSLYLIFDKLFAGMEIGKYEFQNVLLLGMGGGSIISLLHEKYQLNCAITAIEKDEVVIELADKYFNIRKYSSLTVVHDDAFDYVAATANTYDLIISDLFVDNNVPEKFASTEYLANLKRISCPRSCVIYNKITDLPFHKKELIDLSEDFERIFPGTVIYTLYASNVENSLLCCNTLPVAVREPVPAFAEGQTKMKWTPMNPSFFMGIMGSAD